MSVFAASATTASTARGLARANPRASSSRSSSSLASLDRDRLRTTIRTRNPRRIVRDVGRRAIAARAVATPPRESPSSSSSDRLIAPAESPSLDCGARVASVPYFDGAVSARCLVNDAARAAIESARAGDYVALPRADDPALLRVREVIQGKSWTKNEALGSGAAGEWPELFDAGAALVRSALGDRFGDADAVEILPGTGWLGEDDATDAIDWVIRRPEGHVVSSKIHFATRLHRDPDSWTNPRTPQRPRPGWTELAMPERETYAYRFVNVWIARSAIDPSGQVWQSPLLVCLPRDGGEREWGFVKRKLEMREDAAEKEYNVRGINPLDPKTWIPGTNRLLRPLWQGSGGGEGGKEGGGKEGGEAFTEEELETFEFPELSPSDAHAFVTGPAMVFDSFDLWHGAGTWDEDEADTKALRNTDKKGRQPFHRARCSIEMRFRVKVKVNANGEAEGGGKPEGAARAESVWGPFASAVASGKFRDDGLRDSDARYDLRAGKILDER